MKKDNIYNFNLNLYKQKLQERPKTKINTQSDEPP